MKAARLQTEFAPRGVPNSGGLLLLRAPDAIALVNRAAEEGVPILGVDGFADDRWRRSDGALRLR